MSKKLRKLKKERQGGKSRVLLRVLLLAAAGFGLYYLVKLTLAKLRAEEDEFLQDDFDAPNAGSTVVAPPDVEEASPEGELATSAETAEEVETPAEVAPATDIEVVALEAETAVSTGEEPAEGSRTPLVDERIDAPVALFDAEPGTEAAPVPGVSGEAEAERAAAEQREREEQERREAEERAAAEQREREEQERREAEERAAAEQREREEQERREAEERAAAEQREREEQERRESEEQERHEAEQREREEQERRQAEERAAAEQREREEQERREAEERAAAEQREREEQERREAEEREAAERAAAVAAPQADTSEAREPAPPSPDPVEARFSELAGTAEPASPVVEEAPAADPGTRDAGALPESLETLERALQDVPTQPIPTIASRNAESYLDEGNVYFNVGQYGLAIERYSRALESDPNMVAAWYNRANARTRAGDYDAALGDYDRALELAPGDADALNNRGMLHLYRSTYNLALKDFDAALAIDPGDTTVMVNRGLAYLHSDNAGAALSDFSQAARIDSTDAAAHYGAAQAMAQLGDNRSAIESIRRSLALDPGYAREAAADPKLAPLQGDPDFLRVLRDAGA